jgi:hypothetical protein
VRFQRAEGLNEAEKPCISKVHLSGQQFNEGINEAGHFYSTISNLLSSYGPEQKTKKIILSTKIIQNEFFMLSLPGKKH